MCRSLLQIIIQSQPVAIYHSSSAGDLSYLSHRVCLYIYIVNVINAMRRRARIPNDTKNPVTNQSKRHQRTKPTTYLNATDIAYIELDK